MQIPLLPGQSLLPSLPRFAAVANPGGTGCSVSSLPLPCPRALLLLLPPQVLELSDPAMGYNAATGEFTDMVKGGIIDPLKVGRGGVRLKALAAP